MNSFKYVSLFSGVGGFEQALNKLGGKCELASELDEHAKRAYRVLYGGDHLRGDVTKINAQDVPDHDLLVFGFPCQAFSVAGKRLGFDDTRGTLFFEAARIVKEKKPKVLLAENVKGLISHDGGKTLDTIVQTLNDIGYTVDFEVLNSKYFGVPQNRERIFIVAIRDDLVTKTPWVIGKRTDVVAKGKRRISQIEGVKTFNFDYPEQNEVTTRLRDILETDVDERYYLSEEKTAKLVAQLEGREQMKGEPPLPLNLVSRGAESRGDDLAYCLKGAEGGSSKQHLLEPQMLGHVDLKGHDAIKRVYSAEGVSPTLTTMGGGHREPKIAVESPYHFPTPDGINNTLRTGGKGSLTAKHNYEHIAEVQKPIGELQVVGTSNENGHVGTNKVYGIDGVSPTLLARDYKDAKRILEEVRPVLTPDRAEKRQNGRRFKDDGEPSFTLTAQDKHGVAIGEQPRYRIRKLTPLECFRLQGFSDEAHQVLVDAGISNSQRYKMAGNAVTVNVISAIGKRLLQYL